MSVAGWPTEAGSLALKGFKAIEDATVVERLKKNGATIAGSTRMSELGLGLRGDEAARAVAEGFTAAALVTDHLGEARLAAAGAGLIGFKPSYGLVSRYGFFGLIPSMEAIGVLARSADDIAPVMAAVSGTDEKDFSMPVEEAPDFRNGSGQPGIRTLGWVREIADRMETGDREAFQRALERFAAAGGTVVEKSLKGFDLFRIVHQVVGSVEASSAAGRYDGVRFGHRCPAGKNWNEMYLKTRGEIFGPLVKPFLFQGAYFQFSKYDAFVKACRLRGHLVREMGRLLGEADALAMPAIRRGFDPREAASVTALYDAFLFTLPASVAGLPAVCFPPGDGAPPVQIVGSRLRDAALLSMAGEWMKTSAKES
jgi:aspartyl-tRNA(Asn)/glutamyl-tRNA(Gln) amidotransferase subunit A